MKWAWWVEKWTSTVDQIEKSRMVDVNQKKSAVVNVDGTFHDQLYGKKCSQEHFKIIYIFYFSKFWLFEVLLALDCKQALMPKVPKKFKFSKTKKNCNFKINFKIFFIVQLVIKYAVDGCLFLGRQHHALWNTDSQIPANWFPVWDMIPGN